MAASGNKKTILLFVLLGLVVIGIFWIFSHFGSGNARYSWFEHYKDEKKDPYGTLVTRTLIEDYFPGKSFKALEEHIAAELPLSETDTGYNYIFIGQGAVYDSADIEALLQFTAHGNRVFISSKTIPYALLDHLYGSECLDNPWRDYEYMDADSVRLSLLHATLGNHRQFPLWFDRRGKRVTYSWRYMDSLLFCADNADYFIAIGSIDTKVNFARMIYGKGEIFLHTTPLAFSNYHLKNKSGKDYAERVFSHLKEGPVLWDSYHQVSETAARTSNSESNPNANPWQESPLQYMLAQPPLAWAWYLLLVLTLLWLFFQSKRRQRIIPVLASNSNTTKEYIESIGRLFFLQNNPQQLGALKFKLFLGFVRERYQLTVKEPDEQFIKDLSLKSGVPLQQVQKIVQSHQNLPLEYKPEDALAELHFLLEQFYKACK